jgi:hypothetical protein
MMFTSLITATNLFKFTDGASTSNLRPRNLQNGCDLTFQRQCHGNVCVPDTELCPNVTCEQCTQVKGEAGKPWKWNVTSNKCMNNCSGSCITNINFCNGVSQQGAGTDEQVLQLPNQVFNLQPGAVLNINPVSDNTTVNPGPDGNTMIKIDNSAVVNQGSNAAENQGSNAVGTPPATLQALSAQSPTYVIPQDCETCYAAGMKWQDGRCDFACYIQDKECYAEEYGARCPPGTLNTGSCECVNKEPLIGNFCNTAGDYNGIGWCYVKDKTKCNKVYDWTVGRIKGGWSYEPCAGRCECINRPGRIGNYCTTAGDGSNMEWCYVIDPRACSQVGDWTLGRVGGGWSYEPCKLSNTQLFN